MAASKKTYQTIAKWVSAMYAEITSHDHVPGVPDYIKGYQMAIATVARALKEDNPSFNQDLFLTQCTPKQKDK